MINWRQPSNNSAGTEKLVAFARCRELDIVDENTFHFQSTPSDIGNNLGLLVNARWKEALGAKLGEACRPGTDAKVWNPGW
jgi:hypothetical protein